MLTFILSLLNKVETKSKSYTILNYFTFTIVVLITYRLINNKDITYPKINELFFWLFSADFISLITWGIIIWILVKIVSEIWVNYFCSTKMFMMNYLKLRLLLISIINKRYILYSKKDNITILVNTVKNRIYDEFHIEYNQEKINRIAIQTFIIVILNLREQPNIFKITSWIVVLVIIIFFITNTILIIEKNIKTELKK